ncbi:hypothetical protein BOTBODRAFT_190572 [Botryobasidium botryosum FD-172 SS1]|uniref:Uncharacterized protein n=1 Tax=Botryobasidium botryosum (strain FD-172 SS1) TaxID=930990 RepID=A0A067MEB5_BOTB1|nr:hypothetical protein BOTBODRAFT_190572 [Botryobasidium botryosum FD-172 SS1]
MGNITITCVHRITHNDHPSPPITPSIPITLGASITPDIQVASTNPIIPANSIISANSAAPADEELLVFLTAAISLHDSGDPDSSAISAILDWRISNQALFTADYYSPPAPVVDR